MLLRDHRFFEIAFWSTETMYAIDHYDGDRTPIGTERRKTVVNIVAPDRATALAYVRARNSYRRDLIFDDHAIVERKIDAALLAEQY